MTKTTHLSNFDNIIKTLVWQYGAVGEDKYKGKDDDDGWEFVGKFKRMESKGSRGRG